MNKLYCIPSLEQLNDYVNFSLRYDAAFEYNEFFMPQILDDEWSTNKIIHKYLDTKRDCSQDTLHGAFFDICINSTDSKLFDVSNLRVHQCMDIAKKMGIKAVVFHTNYIVNFRLQSYLNTWLKKLKPYVAHIHINDNDGIEDLHLPVGNGILNWNDFTTWGKSLKTTPSILFEVRSFHDLQKSVEYMKTNHIYPFI